MIGESAAVTTICRRLCRCRSDPSAALAASAWPIAGAQLTMFVAMTQPQLIRHDFDGSSRSSMALAARTPPDETGMHGKEKVYGSIP